MKISNFFKKLIYIPGMVCFMLFSCEKDDNNKPEVIGISTELQSYERAVSEVNKKSLTG